MAGGKNGSRRVDLKPLPINPLVFWLSRSLLVTLFLFSVIPLFNLEYFLVDLVSHFRVQYLICGVVALIFFAINRQKPWILASIFCVGVNLWLICPFYFPPPNNSAIKEPKLRLLVANVHSRNTRYIELISVVKAQNPDVIAVLEVTPEWEDVLRSINEDYPFSEIRPGAGHFGIALFSRHPFVHIELKNFVSSGPPSIVGEIQFADQPLKIIATHPVPPLAPDFFALRNEQLKAIAKYVDREELPLVVFGDFNTTPWSPIYRMFSKISGPKNSRAGYGVLPTWPRRIPIFYIPIDHCMFSDQLAGLHVQTHDLPGSDHRMLVTDIGVNASVRKD